MEVDAAVALCRLKGSGDLEMQRDLVVCWSGHLVYLSVVIQECGVAVIESIYVGNRRLNHRSVYGLVFAHAVKHAMDLEDTEALMPVVCAVGRYLRIAFRDLVYMVHLMTGSTSVVARSTPVGRILGLGTDGIVYCSGPIGAMVPYKVIGNIPLPPNPKIAMIKVKDVIVDGRRSQIGIVQSSV